MGNATIRWTLILHPNSSLFLWRSREPVAHAPPFTASLRSQEIQTRGGGGDQGSYCIPTRSPPYNTHFVFYCCNVLAINAQIKNLEFKPEAIHIELNRINKECFLEEILALSQATREMLCFYIMSPGIPDLENSSFRLHVCFMLERMPLTSSA